MGQLPESLANMPIEAELPASPADMSVAMATLVDIVGKVIVHTGEMPIIDCLERIFDLRPEQIGPVSKIILKGLEDSPKVMLLNVMWVLNGKIYHNHECYIPTFLQECLLSHVHLTYHRRTNLKPIGYAYS